MAYLFGMVPDGSETSLAHDGTTVPTVSTNTMTCIESPADVANTRQDSIPLKTVSIIRLDPRMA